MVERVKITPSQIVLKDADGNIKFNTEYYYVKTGSGTLYAGGYDRAPAIYGQNSITDHAEFGGYTSGLFGGTFYVDQDWNYYTNVPRATGYQFKVLTNNGVPLGGFDAPNSRFVKYYNYDTRVLSDTYITFYWQIQRIGYNQGTDGDGNTTFEYVQWQATPILSNPNLPAVNNANGGTFEFGYTANEHLNYSKRFTGYDGDGNYYDTTFYGRDAYAARAGADSDGNYVYIPASPIYFRPCGIFNTRQPIALSLAVTP